MHHPVTWHGINFAGTYVTQRDLQNKESRAGLVRVPLFGSSTASQHNLQADRAKDPLLGRYTYVQRGMIALFAGSYYVSNRLSAVNVEMLSSYFCFGPRKTP